jgi:hypothetical protein
MDKAMNKRNFTLMAVALTVATMLTAATALAQEKGDRLQPGASQSAADANTLSSEILLRLKLRRTLRVPRAPTEPPPDVGNPDSPGPVYSKVKFRIMPRRR